MRSVLTTLLVLTAVSLHAQKLPTQQKVSLRAPTGVKVNGKPIEWGAQYQAYNTATGVFYSIANDDENLYLVIYSNNLDITKKILTNGMDICFNAKKKSTDKGLLVKYPIGPKTQKEILEWNNSIKARLSDEPNKSVFDTGSGRLLRNKAIVSINKQVGIFGTSIITDTLYSIYDAKGIAVGLDCPGEDLLCYELSVPLKYLKISPSASTKINYNIRLNEHFLSRVLPPEVANGTMPGGNEEGTVLYATDFWGQYTLAK